MSSGQSIDLSALPAPADEPSELFRYRPLDDPSEPPDLRAYHLLARGQSRPGDEEADEGPRRELRLVLVTAYDPDLDRLHCLAYVWRGDRGTVVWGLEQWPPAGRLPHYRRDPAFAPEGLRAIHRRYRERGAEWVAQHARDLVAG